MRLAILTSHPIQYYAPLFREIARNVPVKVFFAHRATATQQGAAGFGTEFEWDIDLFSGYEHEFLQNVAVEPGAHCFRGCDTPDIGAKLREGNFSALLVTGWHLKSYWQGIWAAKRCGLPVVVRGDSHLDTPRSAVKRLIKSGTYPALLRGFDAALYVGQRNLAYLRHYGYPKDRLFFSPHCVDTEFFAGNATLEARTAMRMRLGVPMSSRIALFAGKLIPFKRPLDLIQAAAGVRNQGIDLQVMIAGSGELQQALSNEAGHLQVPAHFLGFQNQGQMPAAYAAADVLVLPSSRESWGLVANEAIACGRPVIVSDAVGCAPDLASGSSVGARFPTGDIRALTEAILGVVRNSPAVEAIKMQSTRYSLAAAAQGMSAALERVCVQKTHVH